MIFERIHQLNLIDLWPENLKHEEEYEEEEEEENQELIPNQDFRCPCYLCEEEVNWFHRYYYRCFKCEITVHKFCAEFPEEMEDTYHPHTLYVSDVRNPRKGCDFCHSPVKIKNFGYNCSLCDFNLDINCAMKKLQKNIIYHPSHKHPLVCMPKRIVCDCDACGKEHKGIFYYCPICIGPFIHNHCAFLPKQLQIQDTTNHFFFHTHSLTLIYSFSKVDQKSKFDPRCRVCLEKFSNANHWIYKCEKCMYYTHLDCATSRHEPFLSILTSPGTGKLIKNYKDCEHPDLLHLPFPDPSYSIPKRLFSKENGLQLFTNSIELIKRYDVHQHSLVFIGDARRIKSISFHDPMKRVELLCNRCLRPITSAPLYICVKYDNNCNFVLHEWCFRLPTELNDHFAHPEHTLVLRSVRPSELLMVFSCRVCRLLCNGLVYSCDKCLYQIDANCAFLPKEITHASHPNHLMSIRVHPILDHLCRMCGSSFWMDDFFFSCRLCNIHLHVRCALFIPETTRHKCDKHPLKLSYFPIENHKSDQYFCEICEEEFDPNYSFYHCHDCIQSIHTACAPVILQYETHTISYRGTDIYSHLNVKFGATYTNFEWHPHPLSFVQGIERDGQCDKCGDSLRNKMIFKCLNCNFATDYNCYFVIRLKGQKRLPIK